MASRFQHMAALGVLLLLSSPALAGFEAVEDMTTVDKAGKEERVTATNDALAKFNVKLTRHTVDARITEEAAESRINITLDNLGDLKIRDFKLLFPFVQVPREFEVAYSKNASRFEKISREETEVVSGLTGKGAEIYAGARGYLWKFDLAPGETRDIDLRYREKLENKAPGRGTREYTYLYNFSTLELWRQVDQAKVTLELQPAPGRTLEVAETTIPPARRTTRDSREVLEWDLSKSKVATDLRVTYRTRPQEGTTGVRARAYPDMARLNMSETNRIYLVHAIEGYDESIPFGGKKVAVAAVVDVSGSMNEPAGRGADRRIDEAKSALQALIQELPEYDEMSLTRYSTDAEIVRPLTPLTSRESLASTVRGLTPQGSTNMGAGLQKGIESLRDTPPGTQKHILFLTDGLLNRGPSKNEIIQTIRQNPGITISAFAYGQDADRDFLRQMAKEGRGNYYAAGGTEQKTILAQFLQELEAIHPILARNITFQLKLNDPAKILAVFGAKADITGDREATITLDRLINGNLRTFEVELRIAKTAPGPLTLEKEPTRVTYTNLATNQTETQTLPLTLLQPAQNPQDIAQGVDPYATTQVQADLTSHFLYRAYTQQGGDAQKTREELDRQIQEFRDLIARNPNLKDEYLPLLRALERIKETQPTPTPEEAQYLGTPTPAPPVTGASGGATAPLAERTMRVPAATGIPAATPAPAATSAPPPAATTAPAATPTPKPPGFEAVFGLIALLLLMYLMPRNRLSK